MATRKRKSPAKAPPYEFMLDVEIWEQLAPSGIRVGELIFEAVGKALQQLVREEKLTARQAARAIIVGRAMRFRPRG